MGYEVGGFFASAVFFYVRNISTSTQIENNAFHNGGVTRFQPSALCLYTLTPPSGDGWLLTTKFNICSPTNYIVALVHMFTFVPNDYNNIICPFSQCKSFNLDKPQL
ncbi:hypothetical protein ACTFIR_008494 [Dictyostelium discoideum]